MLENGTFKKKESHHQTPVLTHQSWQQPVEATCLAIMSQGTSSMNVPREGSQLPVVPMGMPLDETLAAEWNADWHIPCPWQHLLLAGLCGLRMDTAHHRCQ